MNLAVFDIDGTLLRSVELDDTCFVRALADVLGIDGVATDWTSYRHPTDSGLSEEIVERHLARRLTPDEAERVAERCCQLLRRATSRGDGVIREVAGASAMLARLRGHSKWAAALASGSWRDSARIKWEAAGLDLADLPAAFAEDSPDRSEILRIAVQRARQGLAVEEFDKVVYVGDAPWDAAAARRLGVAFVGVHGPHGPERLLQAGAQSVLPDFSDWWGLLEALERAKPPAA